MSVYTPSRLPWKAGHVERITVTLDHMLRGKECSSSECAISLAVAEHFAAKYPGTRWGVSVDEYSVGVWECDSGTDQWGYGHNAERFIAAYDSEEDAFDIWHQHTVEPFHLELST